MSHVIATQWNSVQLKFYNNGHGHLATTPEGEMNNTVGN